MSRSKTRCTSDSLRLRYSIRSAMVPILSLCWAAKSMRSGSRAMPPSSRMISHSTVARAVLLDHRPQAQALRMRLGDRHADQAAAVLGKKIDLLRRDEVGGENQVALVLALLVVHQDHDLAGADRRDDAGDRADGSGLSAHSPNFMPLLLLRFAFRGASFLADARRLAGARAQVIELGAAHIALALHLDRGDQRRVGLERALDAFTRRYLAHDERGIQSAVALGDHHAFERLHALSLALDDVDIHHHGVARGEIRHVAGEPLDLFLLECLNQIHVSPCTLSGTPRAASSPLRSAASPPADRAA